MSPRVPWNRHEERWPEERDRSRFDRRDFGQADYSTTYGYDSTNRSGYRRDGEAETRRDDYGQADYRRDYAYDPRTRSAYRPGERDPAAFRDPDYDARRDEDRHAARREEARSFSEERRGNSDDRVIRVIVTDRLERERRLDTSDIQVEVEDGVVFLTGTARSRDEKRRAEDLAEVDGVHDVVNGLRLRQRSGWRRTLGL